MGRVTSIKGKNMYYLALIVFLIHVICGTNLPTHSPVMPVGLYYRPYMTILPFFIANRELQEGYNVSEFIGLLPYHQTMAYNYL